MRRCCIVLLLLFLVLLQNPIEADAVNTGFKTNPLPIEEKKAFVSNSNIQILYEEPDKKTILCFDVNSNGLIAIGQKTTGKKTICVYSTDGVFQYGYTFNCSGDFGIEWDEENLNVYFIRSDVLVSVNPSGAILGAFEVENTIDNNSYVNRFLNSTKRTNGKAEYYIDNDLGILNLFAFSYSQVIVKDANGNENIIYDVGTMQFLNIVLTIFFACISVFVIVVLIALQLKHSTGAGSMCESARRGR